VRRFLVPTFWVSLACAVAFFSFAAGSHRFAAVLGGYLFAWLATCAAIAMSWRDRDGCSSLFDVLLGRQPCATEDAPDLLVDLRSLEVTGVFSVARDILVCLHGGTGTYSGTAPGKKIPWAEDADLFLAWQCPRKAAATKTTQQLTQWQVSRACLRLLGGSCSCTVLMQDQRHRVLLPPLSAADKAQNPMHLT
jgi:hypothetical protein